MNKPYRKVLGLALAPVLAVLVACGGGAAAPTATRPAPTAAPGATAAASPTVAARVIPRGEVKIALRGAPPGLDSENVYQCHYSVWYARIFEGMTNRALDGSLEPALATEWTFAPDGKSATWKLRKGVKFHNGTELKASDVVYTVWRGRNNQRNPYGYRTQFDRISQITAVDDYTVRTDFSDYFLELPDQWDVFFGVVSEQYAKSLADHWAEYQDKAVGTGPFKMTSIRPNESFALEAFEGYWGVVPRVKTIQTLGVAEPTTRLTMLKTGQVDAIEYVPPSMIEEIKRMPDVTLNMIKVLETQHINWVTAEPNNPAVKDKRVRQALRYALDLDAIVDKLWRGAASKPIDFIAPGFPGHNPNIKQYPYDPSKAKQLLAEAGFASGLKIKGAYSAGLLQDEMMEAARLNWADVGVEMKWERVAGGVMSEAAVLKYRGWDAFVSVSRNISYYPTRDIFYWFNSKGGNSSHANPLYDEQWNKAIATADPNEQMKRIVSAYEVILGDEAAAVPLVHPLFTVAFRSDKIKEFPMTAGWSVFPRNLNYVVPK